MSKQTENDNVSFPNLHSMNESITSESSVVEDTTSDLSMIDDSNSEPTPLHNERSTENLNRSNDENVRITTASHTRRVRFPTDNDQLREILYTPDPISKQPLYSLSATLQSYHDMCRRLQLRPINSLVSQLNTMDDGRKSYCDRLDCLRITNEKLDLKHIDAFEEILSRCRFHTLDFESTSIDDLALVQLFEVIEYYESCTHINLSNIRSIGIPGYQGLWKYFNKTNSLERLDMNRTRFDGNTLFCLARALRSSTVYELHVESCQLNGKLLENFLQCIRTCTGLRELYLCDNRIQTQDSLLINELVRMCGRFLHLLDLRSNNLQDSGMSHIASQLSQYDENHTLGSSLHKISFQANQLTQQGAFFLAKSLLHNRTIRSLNLSQNRITNEGFFFIQNALLTNQTINELILRDCQLTDQAAISLAEFIADSTTIQYIDIRNNNIQASGICGMAVAMKKNKSLLKLDFDPIVSIPTNLGFLSANSNNASHATNASSFLSTANLRRMTVGLNSFTNSTSSYASSTSGGGTRELLEQKAQWMYDIATICQRNILIYEENLQLEKDSKLQPPHLVTDNMHELDATNHTPDNVVQDGEVPYVKDANCNNELETSNNESIILTTQNSSENIHPPIKISVDTNEKLDDSLDALSNMDNERTQIVGASTEDNFHGEQSGVIVSLTSNGSVRPSVGPLKHDDIQIMLNANVDQEIQQLVAYLVECVEKDNNQESFNVNEQPLQPPSVLNLAEDQPSNDELRIYHSDSICLMRERGLHQNHNDISNDESSLTSLIEEDDQTTDKV